MCTLKLHKGVLEQVIGQESSVCGEVMILRKKWKFGSMAYGADAKGKRGARGFEPKISE